MELLEHFAQLDASLARNAELVFAILKVNSVSENGEVAGLEFYIVIIDTDLVYFFNINIVGADLLGVGSCIELFFYAICKWEMNNVHIGSFLCSECFCEL